MTDQGTDSSTGAMFDPTELRPGGFVPVGKGWHEPANQDPEEYSKNACNVTCIRGVDARTVIAFLDRHYANDAQPFRQALWGEYGDKVCKADGLPTADAKGTGVVAELEAVDGKLAQMASLADVHVMLLNVRPTETLHAFVRLR